MRAARALAALAAAACAAGCTSLDTGAPRAYPCTEDTECRGGWVCGLERTCHPAEPGPWRCADADGGVADCFGWHCGLEGRCYPKADQVPRPCDPALEADGGRDDCAEGWRCGLERVCHQRGALNAWQCADDSHCEGTWRCGPARACVDPSAEAPVAAQAPGFAVTRLSPRLLLRRPDDVAAGTKTAPPVVFAWLEGTALTRFDSLPAGFATGAGREYQRSGRVDLPSRPDALAVSWDTVWTLEGATATPFRWDADGGLAAGAPVALGAAPLGARGTDHGLLAWTSTGIELVPDDGGAVLPLGPTLDAGEVLRDVDWAWGTNTLTGTWALTTQRLLHQPTPQALWREPTYANADAGLALPPAAAVRVWATPAFVVLRDADGGAATYTQSGTTSSVLGNSGTRALPCGDGGAPLRPVAFSNPVTTWLCAVDGGVARASVSQTQGFVTLSTRVEPATWAARGEPAFADAWGRAGYADVIVLGLEAGSARTPVAASRGRVMVVSAGAWLTTPAGLTFATLSLAGGAPVGGAPAMMSIASFSSASVSDHSRLLAGSAPTPTPVARLEQPTSGTAGPGVVVRAGGRAWMIVANDDALFAGDVTSTLGQLDDGGVVFQSSLPVRLAPSPRMPVLGVVGALGPPDAGSLPSGWVLTTNRASYFEAITERSWVDVPVPLPAGEWTALLGEEGRYRVAYADGQMLSLPSRLWVSERLPDAGRSTTFVHSQGLDYALAPDGPRFLATNPDGGPRGVWRQVPLALLRSEPGLPQDDFVGATLFPGDDGLYVLTRHAELYRVSRDGGVP